MASRRFQALHKSVTPSIPPRTISTLKKIITVWRVFDFVSAFPSRKGRGWNATNNCDSKFEKDLSKTKTGR
jgi:hypothetical protein